jgi:hypothetical protein
VLPVCCVLHSPACWSLMSCFAKLILEPRAAPCSCVQLTLGRTYTRAELVSLTDSYIKWVIGFAAWPWLDIPFTPYANSIKVGQGLVGHTTQRTARDSSLFAPHCSAPHVTILRHTRPHHTLQYHQTKHHSFVAAVRLLIHNLLSATSTHMLYINTYLFALDKLDHTRTPHRILCPLRLRRVRS